MFDKLENIRNAWSEADPIFVSLKSGNQYFGVVPSQTINEIVLDKFVKYGTGLCLGFSYEFFRELEIPDLSIIYRGLASRYPMLYLMGKSQNHEEIGDISVSIGLRNANFNHSNKEYVNLIRFIGDLVDNYQGGDLTKDELQQKFASKVVSPGQLNLIKAMHGLLKQRAGIVELSLGLTEITNHSPTVCFTRISHPSRISETRIEDEFIVVEPKTIIDLWRSIKKVNKDKILYL